MPQHLSFSIKYFLIVLVFSKANTRWVKSTYTVFIHLAVCHTTGPKPLPKRSLHIVRSRASSFKWEYPLLSLRSSNSFLRLLPCRPVTSIPPCIFPSITRFRRQFLRKMWPIHFAFRLRISSRIFLYSLTLSNTSSFRTWYFPSSSSTTFQNFPGVSDLLPEASMHVLFMSYTRKSLCHWCEEVFWQKQ